MIYKVDYVIDEIEYCYINKKPFSIVRPGDGALKLFKTHILKRYDVSNEKFIQQGIPVEWVPATVDRFAQACNEANYILSFELYLTQPEKFPRYFSTHTAALVDDWKNIFKTVGIKNENYIGPNTEFAFFRKDCKNVFDIIRGGNICAINNFTDPIKKLSDILDTEVKHVKIPGEYGKHHTVFKRVMTNITSLCKTYDVFLVGAGDLGRAYSMKIKQQGKIALDIGNVFTAWNGKPEARMDNIITVNDDLSINFLIDSFY